MAGPRALDRFIIHVDPLYKDDCETVSGEMVDELPLMPRAALPERLERWVPRLRALKGSSGNLKLELSQMPAVQIAGQVARAQPVTFAVKLHLEIPFSGTLPHRAPA
jgi:hypothetical protein